MGGLEVGFHPLPVVSSGKLLEDDVGWGRRDRWIIG